MQINDSRELFANGKQLDSNTAPIIVADRLKTPENIGNRKTFADLGQTIASHLGITPLKYGKSFL